MKNNYLIKHFYFLVTLFFLSSISIAQTSKEAYISKITKDVDLIFDGEIIGYGNTFYSENGTVYTEVLAKINFLNYGSATSNTITIVKQGGKIDGKEYTISDANPIFSKNASFFLYKNFTVQNKDTKQNYYLINQIGFDKKQQIIGGDKNLFNSYNELFEAINQKMTIRFEKKSQDVKSSSVDKVKQLNEYLIKSNNYKKLLNSKTKIFNSNITLRTSEVLAANLTLQLTNGVLNNGFLEFDVNIKSNNSTSYLDNVPVWLTYNQTVFGDSVIKKSNIQITSGSAFNNSNYIDPNLYADDQSPNTFAFAVGTDPLLSTLTRVNITTSYKLLAHVKMPIKNCGNVNVNLSNAATAVNASWYTTTGTADFSTAQQYTSLIYSGSLTNNITCTPTIINFNSPVRGGVDTLKIRGYGFGSFQGAGEVQFRNADLANFPYIPVLDAVDYLLWSDTLIKIKMPATVSNQTSLNNLANTPGTGAFIVENDLNQTITSTNNQQGVPFKVYYALRDKIYNNKKTKAHVIGSSIDGNYELYCDSSIGKHPNRLAIVKKAVRDWACLTTININVIYDSTVTNTSSINYLTFSAFSPVSTAVGVTTSGVGSCNLTGNNVIIDFDIELDKNVNWLFDSTYTQTLNPNTYDFYAVVTHEIGHAFGLMHIIAPQSIMYYAAQFSSTSSISGSSRLKLLPNSAEADGGLYQVSSSVSSITSADFGCGIKDITPYNSNCTNAILVKELSKSNFNLIIYPNPSTDGIINLSFDAIENVKPKLHIYDVIGSEVYQETIISENPSNHYIKMLNLENLSNGVYILNLEIGNSKASYKIVKQ